MSWQRETSRVRKARERAAEPPVKTFRTKKSAFLDGEGTFMIPEPVTTAVPQFIVWSFGTNLR